MNRFIAKSLFPIVAFLLSQPISIAQVDASPSITTKQPQVQKTTDSTARKIIALNLKARGGSQAMDRIKALRMSIDRQENRDDFEETLTLARPFKFHLETYRNHLGWDHRSITRFDGKKLTQEEILPEKRNPIEIEGLAKSLLLFRGELFGPFYQFDKKGHTFSYRGEAKVAGKKCYLIRGDLIYNLSVDFYIDAQTFQVIKYRLPGIFAGKEVKIDKFPLGLKNINGVLVETGYDIHVNQKSFRKIEIKEFIPNPQILESDFQHPKVREIWLR